MKICLDPGHGAADPGAVLGKRYEKDDVLRLALAVKLLLEAQGIDVVMTRTGDDTISINERCALANKAGCNYYLSLHRDGVADSTAQGFHIWVHHAANQPTRKKAQSILDAVMAVDSTAQNRGLHLGAANPNWTDYGVNTGTTMASALIEMGFISSPADNARLDKYFDQYAAALCKGLCAAVGKSYNTPIDQPDKPSTGGTDGLTAIMGQPIASATQMRAYLNGRSPTAPDYAQIYLDEGAAEGVRGDIAFAQSCLETGNWTFTGDVSASQNNFAGIGATGGGNPGNSFASPREGIRAQIQHLKCYASAEPLAGKCVDPRWGDWLRGKAPYVEWLGSRENPNGVGWAGGAGYGDAILEILERIQRMPDAPEAKTVTWAEAGDILKAAGVAAIKL